SYACVTRPSDVESGAVAAHGWRFHREESRQPSPRLLGVVVHRRFDCQGRVRVVENQSLQLFDGGGREKRLASFFVHACRDVLHDVELSFVLQGVRHPALNQLLFSQIHDALRSTACLENSNASASIFRCISSRSAICALVNRAVRKPATALQRGNPTFIPTNPILSQKPRSMLELLPWATAR